jgi:hypothetical protein
VRTTIIAGLATVALYTGSALGVEKIAEVTVGGLKLPEYIGPLEYMGERSVGDLEKGARYSYKARGLSLDIYVADRAQELPDGLDAPELLRRHEAAAATAAADEAAAQERQLISTGIVHLGATEAPAAREAVVQSVEGTHFTWLTALHGLLIEACLDVEPGFEEEGSISRGEVLEALGRALPRSAAEVQQARARAASQQNIEVQIVWDPATPPEEQKIWVTYLFTRAAFAAKHRDEGEVSLGEWEASFEEEVRARTVAVNTFRTLKAQDETLSSAYFNDLSRVLEAGFLREYVWRYLRNKSWLGMPPALDLRAFDEWRRTNLSNHVPVTRGRIAFKLAAVS